MKETTLIRLKAESQRPDQLRAELVRIDHALGRSDTTPKQARRYQVRRQIYAAELQARGAQ